ncbi:MAG: glycosyltransferase [Planctomycetes bacterium]|nr:glycosyltransferase [Planctomycetota bacterium]
MISYILPTHNRPDRLAKSLTHIGRLCADDHAQLGGAEVIIVDNASDAPPTLPRRLANGLPVRSFRMTSNQGAAARNFAAEQAQGDWLIMLDDDSYPLDTDFVRVLSEAPPEVAAIGADIRLPDQRREAGGLPEVFVGCGAAIRRKAFIDVGGYDASFHYYAEEYDLCAKLLLAGHRIVHDDRFRVQHEKVSAGRDMNVILKYLVRNNGWIVQRYAPPEQRITMLHETIVRYGRIAELESAQAGYLEGLTELFGTLQEQPQRQMPSSLFDRFTGLAHARHTLAESPQVAEGTRVTIVDEGKNGWAVQQALREVGATIVEEQSEAQLFVIGTLSPGPMLDAYERRRSCAQDVLMPWSSATTPSSRVTCGSVR